MRPYWYVLTGFRSGVLGVQLPLWADLLHWARGKSFQLLYHFGFLAEGFKTLCAVLHVHFKVLHGDSPVGWGLRTRRLQLGFCYLEYGGLKVFKLASFRDLYCVFFDLELASG
jgi:hypothetical protein